MSICVPYRIQRNYLARKLCSINNFLMTSEELVIESCGVVTFETLVSHIIVMSPVLDITGQTSISVF